MSSLKESIEILRKQTELFTPEQWQEGLVRLAPYRLMSSGTLKRGDIEPWQKANSYVAEKIQENLLPCWEDVQNLNGILLNSKGDVRTERIFLGPFEACPLEELPAQISQFKRLLSEPFTDPLTFAALCQYHLVTIHPFNDANGRTSVLLADWILVLHGYLPPSFTSKIDALVGNIQRPSATPENAVLKLLENVKRSYELVLGL